MRKYYPYWGRVVYTHGLGLDQPLSVLRVGYSKDSTLYSPLVFYPQIDWRGHAEVQYLAYHIGG